MANVTMQVEGLRELGEKLKTLSQDVGLKATRGAALAGAQVVKNAAKQKAPKDTGNLEAAILVKWIKNNGNKNISKYIVGVRSGKGKRFGEIEGGTTQDVKDAKAGTGKLGKEAFYWWFHEFGTVKMPARPFLVPAFEQNQNQAIDAMKKRLEQRIKKHTK